MIYQAYPLPPIERFPRNVHATAHYGTLNSFSKQHPLIADHGGEIPLMMGSMSAAASAVWKILNQNRSRSMYTARLRRRIPDTGSNK